MWRSWQVRRESARETLLLVGLGLLAVAPACIALGEQLAHWTNVPIWDEWDTPGIAILRWFEHTLTWSDLVAQHNESRKVIPRLVGILLSLDGRWDLRRSMVLTYGAYCLVSAALLYCLRQSTSGARQALCAWTFANLLLFAPSQFENLLSGYIYEFLVPVLALLAAARINLSRIPIAGKTIACAALSLVATYTFAHGMLVWALACPIPTSSECKGRRLKARTVVWLIVYAAAAAASIVYYFVGYFHPPAAPAPARISQAASVISLFARWAGYIIYPVAAVPEIFGLLSVTAFALAAWLAVRAVITRRLRWERCYVWLLLGAFALCSGLVTAVGRVNSGIDHVFATTFFGFSGVRYTATAVFVCIALIGLVSTLVATGRKISPGPARRARNTPVAACLLICLTAWAWMFKSEAPRLRQFRLNRRQAFWAIVWAQQVPSNPAMLAAYPAVEGFAPRVAEFKRAGLLRLPVVTPALADAVKQRPSATEPTAGYLDAAELLNSRYLRVSGWAYDPNGDVPADLVVIASDDGGSSLQPFATVAVGASRHDVAETMHRPSLRRSGFADILVSSSPIAEGIVLRGCGVDMRRQQAFPLMQSIAIKKR